MGDIDYNKEPSSMKDFNKINSFISTLNNRSLKEAINQTELQINSIKERVQKVSVRLTDEEGLMLIYKDDLEYLLHRLKGKVNNDNDGMPTLNNDLAQARKDHIWNEVKQLKLS